MTRATKGALIVAVCLLLVGILVATLALVSFGEFSFTRLYSAKTTEKTHTVSEMFTSVKVDTLTSDITFAVSQDATCKVVCKEFEKVSHTVTVTDGTLTVAVDDRREWYDHIQLFSPAQSVVLHLPRQVYDRIEVNTDTGDVMLDDMQITGELEIETDTGDIALSKVNADSLRIEVDTGDVVLKQATVLTALDAASDTGDIELLHTVSAAIRIATSTGDVNLVASDAAAIDIATSTGDVDGVLLSPKVFTTDTSTGDVFVPESVGNQTCNVTTSTGDIHFTVQAN